MTPNELLEEVKGRFTVLLHNEEPKLIPLLKKALATYQKNAGVSKTIFIESGNKFPKPSEYLSRISCSDANGLFVRASEINDEFVIHPNDASDATYPLKFHYFISLRAVDLDTYQLPENAIASIADYLEVLIKIPNSERTRRTYIAGGMDTSDIPTASELKAEQTELEVQMKQNKSILPPILI